MVLKLSSGIAITPKTPTMGVMEFKEYIERQFVQWQEREGKRKSVGEFAAYLGVSQAVVSMWMNGQRRPGMENVRIMSAVFGPSVYDVLGLPRPNPLYEYVSRHWEELPSREQAKITELVAKYTTEPLPDGKPKTPRPART